MFNNIGDKIKALASTIAIIGIIASILIGLGMLVGGFDGGDVALVLGGILVALLGSVSSWIGSFLLYGFGDLISNMKIAAHNSYATYTLLRSKFDKE